jgi:O-antigen ligase
MEIAERTKLVKILITGAVIVTLILTPNLNKDSLIIPKVVTLFLLALFFIPVIIKSFKGQISNTNIKILVIIETLLLVIGVLILFSSSAPIDQLLYGRTGRGLGFLTFISTLIIILATALIFSVDHLRLLLAGLTVAGLVTSLYSCLQFFGIDIFVWESATNGIIGTLGNPNSQSSFAATIFIPMLSIIWTLRSKFIVMPAAILVVFFVIYISQSTQGYIGLISAIAVLFLIFFWFRQKIIFSVIFLVTLISGTIAIFGMLGHGPLSYYLYKVSVQSRGDFWRSAFTTGNSHPFLGVGFDTFGDYSLKFRDEIAASHSFAEYTDSAHNFYLDYLATGGYLFLILHLVLTLVTLKFFISLIKIYGNSNFYVLAFFCAWIVIQLQMIINTQTITFLTWNAIFTGAVIGIGGNLNQDLKTQSRYTQNNSRSRISYTQSIIFILIGLIIMYPYFNNDRLFTKATTTGNGDLLIKSVTAFPQTVTRYSLASRALLDSGLPDPALFLARKAVEFNPGAVSLWALILVNPNASMDDKLKAKSKILELDPLNEEIQNLVIQNSN